MEKGTGAGSSGRGALGTGIPKSAPGGFPLI